MTDEEAEDLLRTLREAWSRWKFPENRHRPVSTPTFSLRDLRGAFKGHEKDVRRAIKELEAEHRNEAQDLERDAAMTRFSRMQRSDRANLAVEMSSVVSAITLESILDRNPRISKARLIDEARKRLHSGRRAR